MIFIVVALVILVLGLFVKFKKAAWLIAGYNTASKEKQAEYDKEKLIKYVSNLLFTLAFSYFVWGIIQLILPQHSELIIWVGFGCSFVIMVAGIIYLNSGNRLMKK